MTKAIERKQKLVEQLTAEIKATKSLLIIQYHKLTVAHLNELRAALAEINGKLVVRKNSLVRFATKFLKSEELATTLTGPNAFIYCEAEGPVVAKLVQKFTKKYKSLQLKGAIIDQQFVNQAKILEIATLPTKEELLSMFASSLLYPLRSFAIGVKAIAEQKNSSPEAS